MKITFSYCGVSKKIEKTDRKKLNLHKPYYTEITDSSIPLLWGFSHYPLLFDLLFTLLSEFY